MVVNLIPLCVNAQFTLSGKLDPSAIEIVMQDKYSQITSVYMTYPDLLKLKTMIDEVIDPPTLDISLR